MAIHQINRHTGNAGFTLGPRIITRIADDPVVVGVLTVLNAVAIVVFPHTVAKSGRPGTKDTGIHAPIGFALAKSNRRGNPGIRMGVAVQCIIADVLDGELRRTKVADILRHSIQIELDTVFTRDEIVEEVEPGGIGLH